LALVYLDVKDPIKRAERVMGKRSSPSENDAVACVTVTHEESGKPKRNPSPKKESKNPVPIPERLKHQVQLRDQGRCAQVNDQGLRCSNRRWLDTHHIKPRSKGGSNSIENLITLCSAHHQMEHDSSHIRRAGEPEPQE